MLVAARIAKTLRGGDVVALHGELGAGKTTFVRALARAFGIRVRVTSPTFILMRCYRVSRNPRGIRRLCHVDAYRIRRASELHSIGIGEYLNSPDTVTLVEWADRVKSIVPRHSSRIRFRYGKNTDERTIVVERD